MTRKGHKKNGLELIHRTLGLQANELRLVLASFIYFFSLLCSYYVLRPVRDEMGILAGVENLQWLFTATFLVMFLIVPLFGWLTTHLKRRLFLPSVYIFFILNLFIFYTFFSNLENTVWVARIFFVWVSVFNLMIVSVFWSFMTDIFTHTQGKRLFGIIAAGGSLGAITGPALTATLIGSLATADMLLISIAMLTLALICLEVLLRNNQAQSKTPDDKPLAGDVWGGLKLTLGSRHLMGIALFIWLYTTLSTFLYFEQAHIVKEAFSISEDRTRLFALIDLAVNSLTLLIQVFLTGRIMRRFGLSASLSSIPTLLVMGFIWLAVAPILTVLVLTQIIRRAGNYSITKPSREVLFTSVTREERYKAKNFIDTVVYRGGDALSGWMFAGLKSLGLSLSSMAWIAVPLAILWAITGYQLGQKTERHQSPGE